MTSLDPLSPQKRLITTLQRVDWTYLSVMLSLIAIGLVMMFSTSSMVGLSSYGDPYFFIKRHVFFLLVGSGSFFVGLLVPTETYRKWILPGIFYHFYYWYSP